MTGSPVLPGRVIPIQVHRRVVTDDTSAVEQLASDSGLSRQQVRRAMDSGAVWLSRGRHPRRIRRRGVRLRRGDLLHLYYDPQVLAEQPPTPRLIDDRRTYSVWDKPAGMRSQGSRWGDHTTLVRWAEKHLRPVRDAYPVHRLDRFASGLMLLAHDRKTAAALAAQFRRRRVDKRYRVVVHGRFPATESERLIEQPLDGREARSRVRLVGYQAGPDSSTLDVSIETGRKHQIRRHLAGCGFPVFGDRLYGFADDQVDLQLRSMRLAFDCPLSGERRLIALDRLEPLPGGASRSKN